MPPWVLLTLYNVKCCMKRAYEAPEWTDANLEFSCSLESPRGPVRFDLVVTYHDGSTRFINLMRLDVYQVNFSSRPRVSLTLSSSNASFQVKTLKCRQAEKVLSILSNVKRVLAWRNVTVAESHIRVDFVPNTPTLCLSSDQLPDMHGGLPETKQFRNTPNGDDSLNDFVLPMHQRRKRSLCHLAELEETPNMDVLSDGNGVGEKSCFAMTENSEVFEHSTTERSRMNRSRHRRQSMARLSDMERNMPFLSLEGVPELNRAKLPSWASNVSGISLPKSTDSPCKLKRVMRPYSPVKLDNLPDQQYYAQAIETKTPDMLYSGFSVDVVQNAESDFAPNHETDIADVCFNDSDIFDISQLSESDDITVMIEYD